MRGGRGAVGALAASADTVLLLRDALVEGPNGDDFTAPIGCLVAELGGRLDAEGVALRRCFGVAAYAQGRHSALSLTDALVQGTRSLVNERGETESGRALFAKESAALRLTRVLVEDNAEFGLAARDPGTTVALSAVVIRDVRALPSMLFGQGVFAQGEAQVTGDRVVIAGSTTAGVFSTLGARVALNDSLVTDVRPSPLGRLGDGMVAVGGALEAERLVVRRAFNAGVAVRPYAETKASRSDAVLRDVIVYDMRANLEELRRGTQALGQGILALDGGRIEGASVALIDVTGLGATAAVNALSDATPPTPPSVIRVSDLFIHNVRPAPVAAAPLDQAYGYALTAQDGASIEISRGAADLGAWGFALFRGSVAARDMVVTRQSQGLGMSSTARSDTRFARNSVTGRDNLVNDIVYDQGASELEVPPDTSNCSTLTECQAVDVRTPTRRSTEPSIPRQPTI